MRDYGAVSPRFWTGETGRKLRGHMEAQLVALYLQTAPGSHMIGLYNLALPTLCHETGLSLEGACKGLARLSEVGFAHYDAEEDVIWVPEMARFQIGDALNIGARGPDNRIAGVERELENFRKSKFFNQFLDRYAKPFNLKIKCETVSPSEAPPKGLPSPSEARTGSGQEQEQGHEQEGAPSPMGSAPPAPLIPASPCMLVLPCVGDGPKEFELRQAQVDEWSASYPGVDVLGEARKALAWVNANPTRRKTHRGAPAFLNAWMGRAQDAGGRSPQTLGAAPRPTYARPNAPIVPDSKEAHLADAAEEAERRARRNA